jgi:hypothetical protein
MELVNNPEIYIPLYNFDKNLYEDEITSNNSKFCVKYPNGLQCCNGNIFNSRSSFLSHVKTKGHLKWLSELLYESKNSYKKVVEFEKTIKNQQIIIQHQSNEIFRLKSECNKKPPIVKVDNLIDLY